MLVIIVGEVEGVGWGGVGWGVGKEREEERRGGERRGGEGKEGKGRERGERGRERGEKGERKVRGEKEERRGEERRGEKRRAEREKATNILITFNIHTFLPIILLRFEHLGRIGTSLLLDLRRLVCEFFVVIEVFDVGVGSFAFAVVGPVGGGGGLGFGGCFGSGGGGSVGGFEIALDCLKFLAVGKGVSLWKWGRG